MTKIIQKPLACRNAHCGAMCSIIMAEDCMRIFKEPRKCPNYERDDIGYEHEAINKIRAEIMKLDVKIDDINPDYPMDRTIHISRDEVLQIIDKYKAESEG